MNTPPSYHFSHSPMTPPTPMRMTIPTSELDEIARELFPIITPNPSRHRDRMSSEVLDNVRRNLFPE